ncbi:tRNA (guanosine(46)-N7)-methyltransferase TrmB [Cardiobacterium valvarum]|uniref:tRNA (guanine-N(7)-)-methyltransferase n=1 Tax=Cardiobacterium valvarum F0432 TaxID=797473 RepID=G9ZD61_9GAMM|nr:tRNA (guanosine(46)-N7)-methyltransferase TrmB [Cardiobacterium valvarum]EHM55526.1 tRNA (guanine-N(7)-)-methyltransferase [Cardiobacterium valvarum F0432]
MTIRSFVLRQGRITSGQERALAEYWPHYGLDVDENLRVDAASLFGDERELILEIGFGNGESFVQMAEAAPQQGFVGIEVHRPGVGHALVLAAAAGIDNLRVIRHDAVAIIRDHVPDGALNRVQIYFPDPWPKARHHKRRIVQRAFTDLIWRKLRTGGEIHCATDWENYAEWMRDVFAGDPKWQNLGSADGFAPRPDWRPQTKFERRGERLGHSVWDLRYRKTET